jgi:hypothetical protein
MAVASDRDAVACAPSAWLLNLQASKDGLIGYSTMRIK